ncbi:hypothetical protein H7Y40_02545 [Pedobacter sp.]|nr:hypothetical protein [Candidatus Saccharibacteria bacterium]
MIELNLLPDVKKEFIKAQRTRNTVISVSIIATIGAGVLTALLLSYVYVAQPLLISSQTNAIKKSTAELKAIPEIDKYLTVQNQLNTIDSLHSGLYKYSRAFSFLQQLNPSEPNNVSFSSVIFDKTTNTIEFQGISRNFQALNVFQDTLKNATLTYKSGDTENTVSLFDQVVLQEAALSNVNNASVTSFKFQLVYPDVAFLSSSTDVKIAVPNLTTSDADRNAPKEIFGTQLEGTGL